jgi:hypothetical protein
MYWALFLGIRDVDKCFILTELSHKNKIVLKLCENNQELKGKEKLLGGSFKNDGQSLCVLIFLFMALT